MDKNKDVTKSFFYRLIRFSHSTLVKIINRCNSAAKDLNYLMYQMRFGEREDDIYIVSYPKSGTTRMQMLLYQLTTDGNMDFDHIDDISPWLKMMHLKTSWIKIYHLHELLNRMRYMMICFIMC